LGGIVQLILIVHCLENSNATEDNNNVQVTLQDNTETTHLATGAPVSASIVLVINLTHQKSELSIRLLARHYQ